MIGTATLLVVHLLSPRARPVISVVVVLFIYAALRVELVTELSDARDGVAACELRRMELNDYFAPSAASRFLSAQSQGDAFRYLGYPGHIFGGPFPCTLRWAHPRTWELEVNNRALIAHLSDVQGYNPLHLAPYDRRYLVFPTRAAADQTLPRIARPVQLAFQTDNATVYENPRALPRAWIVHAARQENPDEALDLLARGAIDPRQVALVETAPPELHAPAGPSDDVVHLVLNAREHQRIHVPTSVGGLLVLSEIY